LGKLALLDGDPGLGKSLVTLDLCARLSTGRPLPDDAPGPGACNALVLNGEDGTEDTLRPRLQALGADLERVFVLARDDRAMAGLSLPAHLDVLAQALRQTQARLVVVDPIMAFLDAKVVSVSDAARGSVRRRRERAGELLQEFLAQGPRTSREVWDWARRHGLAERTVNRAKKDLKVRAQLVCEGSQRRTYWLLPLQEVPAPAAAADADDSLEPWLQPLRERFPPSTPLDEE
jgi:hypothetical protein